MTAWVGYLLLFVGVGVGFIFVHLVAGMLFRPIKPHAEKMTIYECGEPTIGSAWIQFDLRFYVVALLFVIFDVEVAFFFPWAVVFGKTTTLAKMPNPTTLEQRAAYDAVVSELVPPYAEFGNLRERYDPKDPDYANYPPIAINADVYENNRQIARTLSWIALGDIAVFFGVLLVGFAYLWRRGDLNWVRSIAAEELARPPTSTPLPPLSRSTAEAAATAS